MQFIVYVCLLLWLRSMNSFRVLWVLSWNSFRLLIVPKSMALLAFLWAALLFSGEVLPPPLPTLPLTYEDKPSCMRPKAS